VRCDAGAAEPTQPVAIVAKAEQSAPEADSAQRDQSNTAGERDDEEESMLAEAGRGDSSQPRRDPEEVALELLQNELGARRIEG
jgi:DNA polymerase-3 subunit gamma/tau